MPFKTVLFTLFLISVSLAGCSKGSATTDETNRVRVKNVAYKEWRGGARILTGELENLTDILIPVAQIDISLFDANNRRVESLMILVRDIGPRASVSFREPVRSEFDIRGARVRAVFVP